MDRQSSCVVAVVGAGIFGCSTAHHLQQAGIKDITLIDIGQPGGGTTGAGAGFIGYWSAGYLEFFGRTGSILQRYGNEFYIRLSDEGHEIECRNNGHMYLALTQGGYDKYIHRMVDHPLSPPGSRRLEPREISEVTGVVPATEVVGAVLHPGAVQVETGLVVQVLARRFVEAGGKLRTETRVLGLDTKGGRVVGVRTDRGDVTADVVILAAGAWNNALLAEVDWQLPLLRAVASRVTTRKVGAPARMPAMLIPEIGAWLRTKGDRYTYGSYAGYEALYRLDDKTAELGQPRVARLVDTMIEKLSPTLDPVFPNQNAGDVVEWVQGIPCYTPDRNSLAGPVPGCDGLFAMGGDNEAGVTHGPGLGRMIAELVVGTAPPFVDPRPYRLDRYAAHEFADERAVEAAMIPADSALTTS